MSALFIHILALPAWLALVVVFALPALEASAFVGFVFPGETALVLGGVLASRGHLPLAAVLAAGIGGAIIGDSVGYLIGRRWGRRVLSSTMGRFVKQHHYEKAERALARWGGWTVFLGRFTAALRVLVPGVAGIGHMPYGRFLVFNVAGGAIWATIAVLIGYLAGNQWHRIAHLFSTGGLVLAAVVAAGAAVLWLRHRRKERAR